MFISELFIVRLMVSAEINFNGKNYSIISEPFFVDNMRKISDKVFRYVAKHGGIHRNHNEHEHNTHDIRGYYKRLSFNDEFFLKGIIINLSGITSTARRYFVDPFRRNFERDIRSSRGICLADVDEYADYKRDLERGFVEQTPNIEDYGEVSVTLEGAIRERTKRNSDFYSITQLPKNWPLSLQLKNIKS